MATNESTFASLPIERGVRLLGGEHLGEAQKRLARASDVFRELSRLHDADELNGCERGTLIEALLKTGEAAVGEVLDMLDPLYRPKPKAEE